jgi:hypothetical protein
MPDNNQHYLFAFEAIPILFHNTPSQVIQMIEKDGLQFLQFWWGHVGDKLKDKLRSEPKGLGFEIRTHSDGRKIVLIRMPQPESVPEAYFIGLVNIDEKKWRLFPWQNKERVFTLEMVNDKEGNLVTRLSEWTPRDIRVSLGKGPEPDMDAFYEAISARISPKKSRKEVVKQ